MFYNRSGLINSFFITLYGLQNNLFKFKLKFLTVFNKYVGLSIVFLMIVTGLISLFIYNLVSIFPFSILPGAQNIVSLVTNYIPFSNSLILSTTNFMMNSITIIITVFLAFFVFTYREQKSITPSATFIHKKNYSLLTLLSLLSALIVYGLLLSNDIRLNLENSGLPENLRSLFFFKFLIFLLLSSCLLYIFIKNAIFLYRKMSVDFAIIDSVIDFDRVLNSLISKKNRARIPDSMVSSIYQELQFNQESIIQGLRFASNNNMNLEFQRCLENYKESVGVLKNPDKINSNIGSYLIKTDDQLFLEIYSAILRSNLTLLGQLFNEKNYNKAQALSEFHFTLFIENDVLTKVFKSNLAECIDKLDVSDERQIQIITQHLKKMPPNHNIIIFKFLLIKLLNRDELNILTNVVYTFGDILKLENSNFSEEENKIYRNQILVVFLQCLIKSIEISNYRVTGFLVKFIITNFKAKDIHYKIRDLKLNPLLYSKIIEEEDLIVGINDYSVSSFQYNNETYNYCFKKGCILLYGQYAYSLKKELWYREELLPSCDFYLTQEINKNNYGEYLLEKVQEASDKYGLLFFKDDEVIEEIREYIK